MTAHSIGRRADRPRRPRPGRDRDPPRLPRRAGGAGRSRRAAPCTSRSRWPWTKRGLRRVIEAQRRVGAPLIVGFNRRFAPLAVELRKLPGPRLMAYRVNAGPLPADHWTNDLARGGGRLKGEGCHFIDFLCDQAGSDPVDASPPAGSRPVPICRSRRPTTSASRSPSPTAGWGRFTTPPTRRSARARSASRPARPASTRRSRTTGGADLARAPQGRASAAGVRTRASRPSSRRSPRCARGGGARRRPRASGCRRLPRSRPPDRSRRDNRRSSLEPAAPTPTPEAPAQAEATS